MEEESIYNLIPKEYVPPTKENIYKSHYPPNMAPTGSTLINHTTSRPGVFIIIIIKIFIYFKKLSSHT